jgi:hypothetical protein
MPPEVFGEWRSGPEYFSSDLRSVSSSCWRIAGTQGKDAGRYGALTLTEGRGGLHDACSVGLSSSGTETGGALRPERGAQNNPTTGPIYREAAAYLLKHPPAGLLAARFVCPEVE